ncbi:MAG TPA: hypothetical protein VLF20_01230, partial [Patescibacteria group bacterium]|nr:hypothetical protein [Patescibacteria group bacterium]
KILEDATSQAGHILNDAQYINQQSKTTVDHALEKMLTDVRAETNEAVKDVKTRYITSIGQLAESSLHDFQTVSQQLKLDLSAQLKIFHDTLLPNMEKEVETYKQQRFKQVEQSIGKIVQQAAQDMFSKSLSLEEHQKLLVDSLEKAKRDGMFG